MLLEVETVEVGFPGVVLEVTLLDMVGLLGVAGLTGVED